MTKKNLTKTIFTVISTISLMAISSSVFSAESVAVKAAPAAPKLKMEKCSGVVADGKADGQMVVKGKKEDWIYIPEGQCVKLVDGKVLYDPR